MGGEELRKMQLKSLGETAAIQPPGFKKSFKKSFWMLFECCSCPKLLEDLPRLLHLAHAAEQLKVSDVRVKAIEEMKREIERMKNQGLEKPLMA